MFIYFIYNILQDFSQDSDSDAAVVLPAQQAEAPTSSMTRKPSAPTPSTRHPSVTAMQNKMAATPSTCHQSVTVVQKKTPATPTTSRGNDLRYLQVQERMLRHEEERVALMRETLQVQKQIANSLEEIQKSLLFKSLQADL